MARRNFGGGGLGTLLLVGGGILLASKLLKKDKKTTPAEAGEARTGWQLNDLCTQAELVDADRAYDDAVNFGGTWGTRPKSKTEAEDRLRLYFSNRFKGVCTPTSPPETFWDVNGNTYFWDGVVQYAWDASGRDLRGELVGAVEKGAQIPRIVGAIVGGPVVR